MKDNLKRFNINITNNGFKSKTEFIEHMESNEFEVYQLFDILYFRDLIKLYNKLPEDKIVVNLYSEINNIRNIVYHHDEILRVYKAKKANKWTNYNMQFKKVVHDTGYSSLPNISTAEINTLNNMKKKTSLLAQLALLNSTYILLSQSKSTDSIRERLFREYFYEINLANIRINECEKVAPWLKCLTKVILANEELYID